MQLRVPDQYCDWLDTPEETRWAFDRSETVYRLATSRTGILRHQDLIDHHRLIDETLGDDVELADIIGEEEDEDS